MPVGGRAARGVAKANAAYKQNGAQAASARTPFHVVRILDGLG